MYFSKFRIIFFALLISSYSYGFLDESCLGGNYSAKVSHKVGIFSLLQNDLVVSKENCTISLSFKKWSLFEKKWSIDYCRMPVHIKYGNGSFDVYKRTEACPSGKNSKDQSEFCKKNEELENIISDEGLIFANGLKEDISSEHGKIYCTFLILKSYLKDGIVYESGPQKFDGHGVSDKTEAEKSVEAGAP
jgi:hypothetical protein